MLPVIRHVSPVKCLFLSLNKMGPSGGASRWRVCYQRGLAPLVYTQKEVNPIFLITLLSLTYISQYANLPALYLVQTCENINLKI